MIEENGDRLQARESRPGSVSGRPVAPGEQQVEPFQHMGHPEIRVPDVWSFVGEPVCGHPDFVEERGAVDLVIERIDRRRFERVLDRTQRRNVSRNRLVPKVPEPIVVRRNPGTRRVDWIEMPSKIEVGPEELVEGMDVSHMPLLAVFSAEPDAMLWHSSSVRTRSACLAA